MLIDGELREVLFQHAPGEVTYPVLVPDGATLCFGLGLDPSVWSPERGDGVRFGVEIRGGDADNLVFDTYIDPKNDAEAQSWIDECVSLQEFAGKNVQLSFVTLPGPAGDATYDWAGWSNPVLLTEADVADTVQAIKGSPLTVAQ
jgi:hypothetical protein